MPLQNFESLCNRNATQIVSRDRGNSQYHKAVNRNRVFVTHYKIDGTVITTGSRCDFLLMNEDAKAAYLIELKGSDLVKAAEQALQNELSGYSLLYRIVANKCRTQEIRSSAYRKYQLRWKERLIQKTGFIEEDL